MLKVSALCVFPVFRGSKASLARRLNCSERVRKERSDARHAAFENMTSRDRRATSAGSSADLAAGTALAASPEVLFFWVSVL